MKGIDTTRLSREQLELLAAILRAIDPRAPETTFGKRMRITNMQQKRSGGA